MQEYEDLSKDFNNALKKREEDIEKARNNREFYEMVEEVKTDTPTYVKVAKQAAVTKQSNDSVKKTILKTAAISVIATLFVTGYIAFEVNRQQKWDDFMHDTSSKIEQMQDETSDMTKEEQGVYWTAYDEDVNNKGVR